MSAAILKQLEHASAERTRRYQRRRDRFWVNLTQAAGLLLRAAQCVIDDEEGEDDLRMLLAPGSPLGGARPKASIRDNDDGQLAIAKFPHRDDDDDIVLWEGVALTLAETAGTSVPEWRIKPAGNNKAVGVDRREEVARIIVEPNRP